MTDLEKEEGIEAWERNYNLKMKEESKIRSENLGENEV